MKLAVFEPGTGAPVKVFSGQPVDAGRITEEDRFAGFTFVILDDTPYEGACSPSSLPNFADLEL